MILYLFLALGAVSCGKLRQPCLSYINAESVNYEFVTKLSTDNQKVNLMRINIKNSKEYRSDYLHYNDLEKANRKFGSKLSYLLFEECDYKSFDEYEFIIEDDSLGLKVPTLFIRRELLEKVSMQTKKVDKWLEPYIQKNEERYMPDFIQGYYAEDDSIDLSKLKTQLDKLSEYELQNWTYRSNPVSEGQEALSVFELNYVFKISGVDKRIYLAILDNGKSDGLKVVYFKIVDMY